MWATPVHASLMASTTADGILADHDDAAVCAGANKAHARPALGLRHEPEGHSLRLQVEKTHSATCVVC